MSWLVNAAKRLLSVPTSSGTSPGALLHPGAWIAPGEIPIEEWLPRFRPSLQKSRHLSSDLSMHQVPWFWIITKQAENGAIEIDEETFTEDGERLVKEMIAAAESQKAEMDATRRTEGLARIHANFNNEIGRLCEKTNIRSGKWICQLPLDIVDEKFDIVATALANPDSTFAATSAHTLKISTTLKGDSHEMHIHAASSFDPNDMTAMARWLVDVAGIVPVGYDCDANTLLGIDANHASGIPSPRYRITDFIPSDELRRKFATKLP